MDDREKAQYHERSPVEVPEQKLREVSKAMGRLRGHEAVPWDILERTKESKESVMRCGGNMFIWRLAPLHLYKCSK